MRLFPATRAAFAFRLNESPLHRAQRLELRRLWNASQALPDIANIDSVNSAQLALHREAIRGLLRDPARLAAGSPFSTASPELLSQLAAVPNVLPALEAALRGDAADFSTLQLLRDAHQRALKSFERHEHAIAQTTDRLFTALAIAALVAFAAVVLWAQLRPPTIGPDLAQGKPRTQSSVYCVPENGECNGYPTRLAFHTNEDSSPWYQIDLQQPQRVSRVWIRNRSDSSQIRAVPLVVEVSNDGVTFTSVARKDAKFSEWMATFPPVSTRYIRVRVDRKSYLHLEAIRVLK
jgi:F5/8 type C domain